VSNECGHIFSPGIGLELKCRNSSGHPGAHRDVNGNTWDDLSQARVTIPGDPGTEPDPLDLAHRAKAAEKRTDEIEREYQALIDRYNSAEPPRGEIPMTETSPTVKRAQQWAGYLIGGLILACLVAIILAATVAAVRALL